MNFTYQLLQWYAIHQRNLPWRSIENPYFIWLSEVILQQTRVEQGRAYYHAFCEKFPTVKVLANASEDEVLKTWQGLGYYSRARNLHATAKVIAYERNGVFPSTYSDLLALKGIGPYTAAAIASFAFGEKKAVVDGNVMRVLSRVYGLNDPIDSSLGKKSIEALANELIPENDPATFNQAIMDFGAIWCTPKNPKCTSCPFELTCVAYRENRVNELPVKGKKTKVLPIWHYYFWIEVDGCIFIRRRGNDGIWKSLYELPGLTSEKELPMTEALSAFSQEMGWKKPPEVSFVSEEVIHLLSHRRIHARFIHLKRASSEPEGCIKISKNDWDSFGWPRLLEKYIDSL
jgi:A/G-specific adenine glycosylase